MRPRAAKSASGFSPSIALGLWAIIALASGALGAPQNGAADATEALFSAREPIPHLAIEVSAADWQRLGESSSVRDGALRPEVAATVRDGTNVLSGVALHLKGARGSFRSVETKPAMTLQFDEHVKGQRFHGLEKISLNNSVQDSSYLCEYLGRRMFAAAGVPIPRATHALVSLNGRPLGLYVLVEGWNKQFLRRHFADASGNFYEPAYHTDLPGPFDVKSGASREDHRALRALTAAIEMPIGDRWAALERTLDLDRFVIALALENLVQHWDGYAGNQNNYRVFHDRTADTIVFFPHGLDQLWSLRRPRNNGALAPPMRGRVASAILETSEGLTRYYERAGWLLTNVYVVASWTAETRRMGQRLRPALAEDPEALARFEEQLDRLLDQMAARHEIALRQWNVATAPMQFEGIEPAVLRNWQLWRSDGARGFGGEFGFGFRGRNNGPGYLRLDGGRAGADGTWRTTVLLEPGRYRFEGQADHSPGAAAHAAIAIRSSVPGNTRRSVVRENRTSLVHEFSAPRRQYVELRCEGGKGLGWAEFDPESLKLSRIKPD